MKQTENHSPPVRKSLPPNRPFLCLLRYNLPYWRQYALGAVLAVIFVGVSLAMPVIVRAVVSGFETGAITSAALLLYFAFLLLTALCTGVARYFQRILMIGASRRFEYDLRNDYFRQIQRLSQRFFNRMSTGDIMARATNDLNYVRDFIGPGIMGTVDMIRVPFTLAMMVYFSAKLTLVALIPLPVLSVLVYGFMRFMNRQSKVVQELFSQVTARVQENLAGARVVKAYGIADRECRDFEVLSKDYLDANLKLTVVMSAAWPIIETLIGVAILAIVWQGGGMVIRGELSLGNLTAFLICLIMLAWPLVQFGWVLSLYQRGAVGMKRIVEILNQLPEIADSDETDAGAEVEAGDLRFEGVSFDYHAPAGAKLKGAPAALRGIDVAFPAGKTTAIVGPTGSGKSSLISLVVRDYDPNEGRISIDGHDLRSLPVKRLRAAIGYVPQDTFVFSDTIAQNLRMAKPEASESAIRRACDLAQLSETLEGLPDGLDTMLGERGINLSGGQKQRLALARAIVTDPKILILDDAFSSVDTHTEEEILKGLGTVTAGRTAILISHRISTVRGADLIVVLEEGRVVAQGSHEELLAEGGLYARIHERQLLEEALEEESCA